MSADKFPSRRRHAACLCGFSAARVLHAGGANSAANSQ